MFLYLKVLGITLLIISSLFALLLLISLLIIFYPIPSVLIMYFSMVYALVYDYVSTHEKLNNQYQTFKNKWKEDDSNISKNI